MSNKDAVVAVHFAIRVNDSKGQLWDTQISHLQLNHLEELKEQVEEEIRKRAYIRRVANEKEVSI